MGLTLEAALLAAKGLGIPPAVMSGLHTDDLETLVEAAHPRRTPETASPALGSGGAPYHSEGPAVPPLWNSSQQSPNGP